MGFLRGVSDVSMAMKMDDLHAEETDGEHELKAKLGEREGEISYAWFEMEGLVNRTERMRVWRQEVKSLNGWRESWTLLHWVWIVILFVLGLPFWAAMAPVPWFVAVALLFVGLWGWGRRWWKGRKRSAGKKRSGWPPTYSEIDEEVELAPTPRPPVYEEWRIGEASEPSVLKSVRPDRMGEAEGRETS